MLVVETIAKIRRAYFIQGKSIKQTCASGVSVAQVARRYAMNANLIHKWLRDPRYAPDVEIFEEQALSGPCFFPVEIDEQL